MRVSEYVAQFLADLRPEPTNVYAVCGSAAMHLNDAICHHPGINVIPMQHEQAATYAAEAESRVRNHIAVVHCTGGPGVSNTLTGVSCAFVDSIPLIVLAGQVTSHTMIGRSGLRQSGINELNAVELMRPVTKYAVSIKDPKEIHFHLSHALYLATHGRKGPVFIEIPLDVQAAEVDPGEFKDSNFREFADRDYIDNVADAVCMALEKAQRPVLIIGNGIRLADACKELERVVNELQAPVISSWAASDVLPNDNPYYIGRMGLFGDRASNWAVQNADLVLAIGARLSVGQIGHHAHLFAPKAKKIVVDIDGDEANKASIKADFAIVADAKKFLRSLRPPVSNYKWLGSCRSIPPEPRISPADGVGAYDFIKGLNGALDDDAIVVTDAGFAYVVTMQTLRLNGRQRLMYSQGVSPMGWGLPAAIGAAESSPGRQVVCIVGDGGLMMNVQELHTIAERKLPIAIFVVANDGYETMRISQRNNFKREAISGPNSGMNITCSRVFNIIYGFGIDTVVMNKEAGVGSILERVKRENRPIVSIMRMAKDQIITPRIQTKVENGKFVPASLMDMWPETNDIYAAA